MNTNITGFTNTHKINQEAAEWILLLEDTPNLTQQQVADLNAWVNLSDVHKKCLTDMANSWNELDLLSSVMLPKEIQKQFCISRFFANLSLLYITITSFFIVNMKKSSVLLRPAFILPLTIATLTWFSISHWHPNDTVLLVTKEGKQSSHLMDDGSVVWLNSSTTIAVDYSAHYRRINLIKGEAHFEVAKNANRPFEVYAEDRLIRAIGTAFSVRKLSNSIEVLVTEGSVELAIVDTSIQLIPDDYDGITIAKTTATQSNPLEPIILINPVNIKEMLGKLVAGQRIKIPTINDDIKNSIGNISELDNSEIVRKLSWKDGKLVFAGESLEEVINEITRHTAVKIDVLDPKLKLMRIGGQFEVGETAKLFYVLESSFGISINKLNKNHVQLSMIEKNN